MFLSAVRSTSKPARSASASKSPLVRVSQPRSFAFVTVWPPRDWAIPVGVTWSNRMSIHRRMFSRDRDRIKAAGGKFKDRVDLRPRNVELLDDFFDGGSGFKVFEHGGHGHPGIAKYPCAIQSPRHAFNCGALGPIESCHAFASFHRSLFTASPQRPLASPLVRMDVYACRGR